MACIPDSSGARWFACRHGTVGCPYIHDGLTPHCIACSTEGMVCEFNHQPPAMEMTLELYLELTARQAAPTPTPREAP